MHIAEGVLSPMVLGAGFLVTGIGTYIGIRQMRNEQIIPCGILAAVFFLASLIHVPIGISSAHLIAAGLIGIFLKTAAYPTIFTALLLQGIFFQFGGITVLGVNCATMATAACLAGAIFRLISRYNIFFAGFMAGALGVLAAALFTAAALAFSEEGFVTAAKALFLAHTPIMLAEGILTGGTVAFLARMRPDLLTR
ncbi:MAG: cobalt transporter CbiM [Desulfovibrionaceae bacterium]|nr:cobalt transporter CbiM [Desulfovibrionaceae bacterium]